MSNGTSKNIIIIGAGFAGLSSARVLIECGHSVRIYEKVPDVGGVWSSTRRYPGLRTQNNKGTYALSELPMPKDYPEWPTGEQVQHYLESYVDKFDLAGVLQLSSEVTAAVPSPGGGWDVTIASLGDAGDTTSTQHADHLVLASGIFSRPFVPAFEGRDVFEKVGGEVLPASDLHSLDQVAGKHAIVVGYGKSACDVAVEVAQRASSTTVLARDLLWKMPRKIKGVLNYKYLVLTRMGEALFRYEKPAGVERVLHARGSTVANAMLGSVEGVTTKQLGLPGLGLVPPGTFSDIARSTVSLVTEGFFEGVRDGRIDVRREAEITRLLERDGRPHAELSDASIVPADVVLAATGWSQEIPFLSDQVMNRLTDETGDFLLYRHIHPIGVADMSFAGYNSSFFSPLSAEASAIWIASLLGGNHSLPSTETMLKRVRTRLAWMRERTRGKHARGTNVVPFSVHNIDEVLGDVGLNVSPAIRAKQWLLPIDPSDYRGLTDKIAARVGRGAPR